MNFPRLTFPLTVDFGSAGYWIGDVGPFYYGAAVTEFFCEDDLADDVGDGLLLMRRLEDVLKAFGGHLQPYVVEQQIPVEMFLQPEKGNVLKKLKGSDEERKKGERKGRKGNGNEDIDNKMSALRE